MAVLLNFIAAMAAGLSNGPAVVDTTLCAVVAKPKAFSGKVVRFRAGVFTDWQHGTVLVHSGCQRGIELSSTDGVPSDQSKAFDEAVGTSLDGGRDRTAMATFTGHFSFHPGARQGAFDNPLKFNAGRIEDIKTYHKR
jgi:hypothetical protein